MSLFSYLTLQISHSTASEYGKPIHNLDNFSDDTIIIGALFGAVILTVTLYAWWKQKNKRDNDF